MVLARVGNRVNGQPLETSREVCEIRKEDRDLFSQLILKPFRSHVRYRFDHHSSLDKNETFSCVREIFSGESSFLEKGANWPSGSMQKLIIPTSRRETFVLPESGMRW